MTNNIAREVEKLADDFGIDKKRSIGDVAHELGVEPHVIRFWEEQFPQIKPEIGKGGRRYYYNKQLKVLKRIKKFLHEEGYTIAGLQKLLKRRKHDSYKEEDLDIIMVGGIRNAERDIDDFIEAANGVEGSSEGLASEVKLAAKNVGDSSSEHGNGGDVAVAERSAQASNIGHGANINKASDTFLAKEQRDEISSLFKNITKNLGDLKMLLRS